MRAGEKIGRYEIQKRLAAGGMAEIFLAKLRGEAGFEKDVVLKKILPQWSGDADFIAMLVDEAKIAVRLTHPNIVQVYELAREGETIYIALEYVRGADLRRLLQKLQASQSRMPLEAALFVAAEVLAGLAYAHAARDASGRPLGIVHRDVSPQNVLLSFDGGVKLADFGIAKAASRSQETATGILKGKFAYMSPEQANQESLDGRSDLFSLAVVLYEMLTGERLFYRGSDVDTLDRVRRCDLSGAAEGLKTLPEEVGRMVLKGLERKPQDRYQDGKEFREALHRAARALGKDFEREDFSLYLSSLFPEEGEARPPLDPTRTVQPVRKMKAPGRRTAVLAAAAFAALAITIRLSLPQESLEESKNNALFDSKNSINIKETLKEEDPRPSPPEIPIPVRPDQAIAVPAETRPAASAPLPAVSEVPVVSLKDVKPAPGYLTLQALPYGTVTVDGGRGRETPVRRIPLTPGRHVVRVSYAPDGSVVSTTVTAKSGREIVCIAQLRGGKTITCGD